MSGSQNTSIGTCPRQCAEDRQDMTCPPTVCPAFLFLLGTMIQQPMQSKPRRHIIRMSKDIIGQPTRCRHVSTRRITKALASLPFLSYPCSAGTKSRQKNQLLQVRTKNSARRKMSFQSHSCNWRRCSRRGQAMRHFLILRQKASAYMPRLP